MRRLALTTITALVLLAGACSSGSDGASDPTKPTPTTLSSIERQALADWLTTYEPDMKNWTDVPTIVLGDWSELGAQACGNVSVFFANHMAPKIGAVPNDRLDYNLHGAMTNLETALADCRTRDDAVKLRVDASRIEDTLAEIRAAADG